MKVSKVAKAAVAAVGLVLTSVTNAVADDVVNLDEAGTLVSTLVAAALSVYAVWKTPNAPQDFDAEAA